MRVSRMRFSNCSLHPPKQSRAEDKGELECLPSHHQGEGKMESMHAMHANSFTGLTCLLQNLRTPQVKWFRISGASICFLIADMLRVN